MSTRENNVDRLTNARISCPLISLSFSSIFASEAKSDRSRAACQSLRTDNGIENLLTKSSKMSERGD